MTTNRYKSLAPLLFADLYSGSGVNEVGGVEIDGSPISMLHGIFDAVTKSRTPVKPMQCLFSDIARDRATYLLPERVEAFQRSVGIPEDRTTMVITMRSGIEVRIPILYGEQDAATTIRRLTGFLVNNRNVRVLVGIDPNGPKDAPWAEMRQLWQMFGSRVDIFLHLAATAMKRVSAARAATDIQFAPMPDHIQQAIQFICEDRGGGWVREPLGADQWTMMLLTRFPPKHGWGKQNYHLIQSVEGQEAIKRMSMTKKALAELHQ